jgi:WD40 repeat protein
MSNPIRRQVVFDERNEQCGIATAHGFIIYDLASTTCIHICRFPHGGAQCLAILNDSNLIAASGDSSLPGYQNSAVILWDSQSKDIFRIWTVPNPIDSLIFKPESLIIANGDKILFYDTCNFEQLYCCTNPIVGRFCVAVGNYGRLNLAALPSLTNDRLNICDYRDPSDVLGSIPIPFKDTHFFAFDRQAELLAIVTDEGRTIQLWSVVELKLIQKFKRGSKGTDVSGLAFDHMSSFLCLTMRRGTIHIFAIPPLAERGLDEKAIRAKFNYGLPKGKEFSCQFDPSGFAITAVAPDGTCKQFKLDLDQGAVGVARNLALGLENT